jgi:acyl-coenzyme A thioesterase PaaI-like protein
MSQDPLAPAESKAPVPLPWSRSCFVCGEDNPLGLRARSYQVADRVELPFQVRPEFSGWSGVTHGGLIATVLDEVMTWAAILASERPCFAAEFSVRLQRPLPPSTQCVAAARASGVRRSIVVTEAELRDREGLVYAKATGRYMTVPADRARHLRSDFVGTPDCLDVQRFFRPSE